MGLTILLIALIVLACLFVIFLGHEAKKISNAYLDSVYSGDADFNKPTLIRINDDEGLDYILNTDEISVIFALNDFNEQNYKYLIRISLKHNDNPDIILKYDDKLIRDEIYDALADYNIHDKLKSNE